MECFVYAYSVSNCAREGLAVYDLQIVSDRPVWVQKRTGHAGEGRKGERRRPQLPPRLPLQLLAGGAGVKRGDEPVPAAMRRGHRVPRPVPAALRDNRGQPLPGDGGGGEGAADYRAGLRPARRGAAEHRRLRALDIRKARDEPGARIFGTVPPGKSNAHWPGSYNVALDLYNEGLVPTWRQM